MIALADIDRTLLENRGAYATVRGAHEDAKKLLSTLAGDLTSVGTKINRRMQPNDDAVPESVEDLIAHGRELLDQIEQCAKEIESLAIQRAELKPLAWPKK